MRHLIKIIIFPAAALSMASAQESGRLYGVDYACSSLYGDAFLSELKNARSGAAGCLAGAGLLEEALHAARTDGNEQELSALLSFVLQGGPGNLTDDHWLVQRARAGERTAGMWLMIARPQDSAAFLAEPQRLGAVGDFLAMPGWLKERFAVDLWQALTVGRDRQAALALGAALEDAHAADTKLGAIGRLLHAKSREDLEHYEDALDRYASVTAAWDDPVSIEARFRQTALLWRLGRITTGEAVGTLSGLSLEWRSAELAAQIDLALARALTFDGQPLRAARILSRIDDRRADGYAKEAKVRLRQLLIQTFAEGDFPVPPVVALSLWETARPHLGDAPGLLPLDLRAAEYFASHGLRKKAGDILAAIPAGRFETEAELDEKLAAARLWAALGRRERGAGVLSLALASDPGENAPALMPVGIAVLAPSQLGGLDPKAMPEAARAALEDRAWREGLYAVHAAAAEAAGDERESPEVMASRYLASGERLERDAVGDPLHDAIIPEAISPARRPSDLRAALEPADRVLALKASLRRFSPATAPADHAALVNEPSPQGNAL